LVFHLFLVDVKALEISVDYSDAAANGKVEGDIAQPGALIEVKLFGKDGNSYLAYEVEVEEDTVVSDD